MNQTLTQIEEDYEQEFTPEKVQELGSIEKVLEKGKYFLTQSNLRVIEKVKEIVGEDEPIYDYNEIRMGINQERQRIRNLLSLIEQK